MVLQLLHFSVLRLNVSVPNQSIAHLHIDDGLSLTFAASG
jgi:hypothetical protein